MRAVLLCCAVVPLAALLTGCGDGSTASTRVKTAATPRGDGPWEATTHTPADAAAAAAEPKAVMDSPRAAVEPRTRREPEAPAGILTAGSFDDNLFPQFFHSFANKAGQNPFVGPVAVRFLGRRVEVTVRNGRGEPVGNARVRVTAAGENNAAELITRSDGRAVFVSSLDRVAADGPLTVTASAPGGPPVAQAVSPGADRCTVVLPAASGARPVNLDLAIVLDTTGSMGDELRFLKAEVKDIAAAVRARFPNVSQRFALVCYRDTGAGEDYVTRRFDFTPDVDAFARSLSAQSAAGGGDLPEAMHRGLADAVGLHWRDEGTARVLLLIADAPPHSYEAAAAVAEVEALRRKGVAIHPVFASCNDPRASEAAELLMRGAAMATGGRYLFLTDDSGVGDAHGEPHIPHYHVERLTHLLARVIADELAGARSDPDPRTVIRTVGQPPRLGVQE